MPWLAEKLIVLYLLLPFLYYWRYLRRAIKDC